MSSKTFGYVLAFSLGAAVGTAVSWRILKSKYEQIAQEEIDSVKEVFSKRSAEIKENDGEETLEVPSEEYEQVFKKYSRESTEKEKETEKKPDDKENSKMDKPYVIKPEELGDTLTYDTDTLIYYADGVLADLKGNIIPNVDEIVGKGSLTRFGEYEEDTVYVRNNKMECDYEICRDEGTYSEVYGG